MIDDFVDDEEVAENDLFDCEYTSVDAVINKVTVSQGHRNDKQRMVA